MSGHSLLLGQGTVKRRAVSLTPLCTELHCVPAPVRGSSRRENLSTVESVALRLKMESLLQEEVVAIWMIVSLVKEKVVVGGYSI